MFTAFLYDAKGKDREASLEKGLPKLAKQHLLWIDVVGREASELKSLAKLLDLDSQTVADLQNARRSFSLSNFGRYVHFDVLSLYVARDHKIVAPKVPHGLRLDFIMTESWLLTVHEKNLAFLHDFREQDRGETLIGNLSPAALAASLLDWHLSTYLAALGAHESFVDMLDVQILKGPSIREDLLGQVVAGRRFVSALGRMLTPQRAIFYGLSRPDLTMISASGAGEHFKSLEHRFERTVDSIEHGRDLMKSSFDLFTARIGETTNLLIRRLTFLSLILGAVGAVAGVFGMNFQTPYTSSGVVGFWTVLAGLAIFALGAAMVSRYRHWI